MLAVTFADLLFRARQFAIAIVGVGLVLALALALSGLADGFRAETSATVNSFGASSWVMSRSAHGSIIAFGAFPAADASEVARQPGIHRASEVLVAPGPRPKVLFDILASRAQQCPETGRTDARRPDAGD